MRSGLFGGSGRAWIGGVEEKERGFQGKWSEQMVMVRKEIARSH